jgi:predicted RNA binding protein YcfA (HicA-like mRNA interferase family)
MKKLRIRGKYAEPLIDALEKAGFEVSRRSNGSHIVFSAPERAPVYVPAQLDCKSTATKIARAAGLSELRL